MPQDITPSLGVLQLQLSSISNISVGLKQGTARTEGRWHIHKIASDDLGLNIYVDELTSDEILQVTGESNSSTPSMLTGQQICKRVEEAVMSQHMDLFEDRMSEEPLEYFGEPTDSFPKPSVLTDKDNRTTNVPMHFEELEDTQVQATQMETVIRLQPNLWRDPQEANIQRTAGENPAPRGSGGGGGRGGGRGSGGRGGGSRGSGGGGGNPPPPPGARGNAGEEETKNSLDNLQTCSQETGPRQRSS